MAAGSPALTLTLTADGRVLARGRAWSLDGLRTLLRAESTEREALPGTSIDAARLVVRLRIDRAVPWRHVQWVLTVLAEEKVWRTRFVYADPLVAEADLEWNLPYDLGLCGPPGPPDEGVVLRVNLRGVRPDPALLRARVDDARHLVAHRDYVCLFAEVRATPATPWGEVAAAFERLRAEALQVDFLGSDLPAREVRSRAALPPDPLQPPRAAVVAYSAQPCWFQGDRWRTPEEEPEIPAEGD